MVTIDDQEKKLIASRHHQGDKSRIECLMKDKDKEIQLLKGKLNIPTTKHIQTKELIELEKEKE
jgi:hypothetical protein